jgi:glycine/D-amino acid oxidase-like deaminating enzyme
MTRTADVVVIGGGLHGCSTALHLALRGLKPILVEKDYAGRHASGVNAGGVRQLARHIAEIPLSIASMAIWENIEELVGDDCGFSSHGTVLVAESEQELAGFRDRVDDLRLKVLPHEELIDRTELKRLGAGGVRPLSGRRGLAPRWRRRSVPHHPGLPPPRRRARRRGDRGRAGDRPRAPWLGVAGRDQRRAD